MDFKKIDYVLELAKTLNFNQAAANLFISQPTLTYQIKAFETEIGFKLFERNLHGVSLTAAGVQFIVSLRAIDNELKAAIEQGQNFSQQYAENINIGIPTRAALHLLPEVLIKFKRSFPTTTVTPTFSWDHVLDGFQQGQLDAVFAYSNQLKTTNEVQAHLLFNSPIYVICKLDDPMAAKEQVSMADLADHTLLVGGGSPDELRQIQDDVKETLGLKTINSPDHSTTLLNIASNQGVSLAPGFLNDHNHEFAWVKFVTPTTIPCYLYTHVDDERASLTKLIQLLDRAYR